MCLDYVDKKPKVTHGFGYKLMYQDEEGNLQNGLIRSFFDSPQGAKVEIGEPVKDNNAVRIVHGGCTYPAGYHIFKSLKGLREFQDRVGWWQDAGTRPALGRRKYIAICRVKYSDVVATGHQEGVEVVVARKMEVIEVISPSYACYPRDN